VASQTLSFCRSPLNQADPGNFLTGFVLKGFADGPVPPAGHNGN
jgi:hypothetical protein